MLRNSDNKIVVDAAREMLHCPGEIVNPKRTAYVMGVMDMTSRLLGLTLVEDCDTPEDKNEVREDFFVRAIMLGVSHDTARAAYVDGYDPETGQDLG